MILNDNNIFFNLVNLYLIIAIFVLMFLGGFYKANALEKNHPMKLLTISNRLASNARTCKSLIFIYKSNNPLEFTSCFKLSNDIKNFLNSNLYNPVIEKSIIGLDDLLFKKYQENKKVINHVYFDILKKVK